MNQNFFEPNLCYEPNSSSFDQYQPLQSFVTQQIPQRSNEDIKLEMVKLIKNNRFLLNDNIFPHEEASMEVLLAKERILKLIQAWVDKQIESWSLPALLLQLLNDSRTIDEMLKNEYLENSSNAIATVLPTEEPEYSLSMRDEHLITIPETESDEVIKSSVKNLVQIPSEYEVTSDDESECDVPITDGSSPVFTTFSNPIFDDNDDYHRQVAKLIPWIECPMVPPLFLFFINQLFERLRRKTSHSQLVDKKLNSFSAKSFSEEVRQLILCVDEVKFNYPIINLLFDEMISESVGHYCSIRQ
nr:hypothetical protein [Tanacetum cinerariifolium]